MSSHLEVLRGPNKPVAVLVLPFITSARGRWRPPVRMCEYGSWWAVGAMVRVLPGRHGRLQLGVRLEFEALGGRDPTYGHLESIVCVW